MKQILELVFHTTQRTFKELAFKYFPLLKTQQRIAQYGIEAAFLQYSVL